MVPEGVKSCCASLCTVVSVVAIPVLVYIALLCGAGSRLIEIPQDKKTSAAVGCWVAAALYAATFFVSYNYKARRALDQTRASVDGYQLHQVGNIE